MLAPLGALLLLAELALGLLVTVAYAETGWVVIALAVTLAGPVASVVGWRSAQRTGSTGWQRFRRALRLCLGYAGVATGALLVWALSSLHLY